MIVYDSLQQRILISYAVPALLLTGRQGTAFFLVLMMMNVRCAWRPALQVAARVAPRGLMFMS